MKKQKVINIIKEVFAWLLSLVVLIPLMLVVINSLKSQGEADLMNLRLPTSLHLDNYMMVIEKGKLIRSFLNSFLITSFSVVVSVIVSSMASFVLSRNRIKFNNVIYNYFLLGLIAPLNMIPVIRIMKMLHLLNNYHGIVLLYTALVIPFSVFLYYGFIKSVPQELDEAAMIDGCSSIQLFLSIVLPLLKPVTITVIVVNFLGVWNDFMVPLYMLNRSDKWTMTLAVYNFYGTFISKWNLVCANIIMTIAPILIVYVLGQKYIISGMVSGAVKG
ncbi:MAG: ABC transporter permease [Clostridiales bacterium GWC2_40_7]|nr:MAG: ABC transporter permease [Clostridiales bacterium GWC2_40_7]